MRTIRDGWAIDDQNVSLAIDDIPVLSKRAHSYLARHADPALTAEGVMIILGAIKMLGGMEHHYASFLREQEAAKRSSGVDYEPLEHEAIAFLGRIGQFGHFVRSSFAKRVFKAASSAVPTIDRLMVFRNKHTAHRSLDAPRDEPVGVRISHQLGMSAGLFMPRPGARPIHFEQGQVVDLAEHRRFLLNDYYLTFQIIRDDGRDAEQFVMEVDGLVAMSESYSALVAIISHR